MKTIRVEITHRDPDILAQKVEDYYRAIIRRGMTPEWMALPSMTRTRHVWVALLTRLESCD